MKPTENEERICPICGNAYRERPALPRKDNDTLICPDCGAREALAETGVDTDEQEKILDIIHRHTASQVV